MEGCSVRSNPRSRDALHAGPDAPTRRLRRVAGAVRGALTDTRPLQTASYRRLWLAGVVTVVGAQLSVVAVPPQIYQLTGSSAWVRRQGVAVTVSICVWGASVVAFGLTGSLWLAVVGGGLAVVVLAIAVVRRFPQFWTYRAPA